MSVLVPHQFQLEQADRGPDPSSVRGLLQRIDGHEDFH